MYEIEIECVAEQIAAKGVYIKKTIKNSWLFMEDRKNVFKKSAVHYLELQQHLLGQIAILFLWLCPFKYFLLKKFWAYGVQTRKAAM